MNKTDSGNINILVIDDEKLIRELYKDTLVSENLSDSVDEEFSQLESTLFGEKKNLASRPKFNVISCKQAEEAVNTVALSHEENKPFSVAFIDVLMPPGPTGVWAAEKIREIDPYIEIVIVTAHATINLAEIMQRVEPAHKIIFIQKPIYPNEIQQFALSLSAKWHQEKTLLKIHQKLEQKVADRTKELADANRRLIADIEQRKAVEKALQQSEHRYRLIFENAGDAIFILDAEKTPGKIIDANKTAARMHGYTRKELLDLSIQDLDTPTAAKNAPDKIRRLMQGEWIHAEIDHQRKDGSIFPVEISAGLINFNNRKLILAIDRDITERKRAEEANRQRESLMRVFVENTPAAVAMFDLKMRYIAFSKRWVTDFGLQGQQLLGKSHYDILPEIPDRWREQHQLCMKGEFLYLGEEQFQRSNGKDEWIRRTLYPWRGADNKLGGIIIFSELTTQQKKIESEKKQLEHRLQQSHKMEAIGTLAGGIAHDFNNILAGIMGYTELVLMELEQEDPIRQSLEKALTACDRGRDLVKQILTFSRQSKGENQELDLRIVVAEMLKLLRPTLPSTIEIRYDPAKTIPQIHADATQIHQVVMNLCTNAAHAMADNGGQLSIILNESTINKEIAASYPSLKPGTYVKLSVSDTGHGMDNTTKERVFEPFFTTKDSEKGTGLGLSVVHGIVQNHGGMINVYSEPEKGTSFNVYLPAIDGKSEKKKRTTAAQIPTGTEKVLFVDDEEALADIGRSVLERLGYTVTAMTDGRKALDLFKSNPVDFDLVISDVTMPKITGYELAAELIKIRSDLPVILCSGFSGELSEENAKKLGIRSFVMKPISMIELASTIRQILDG